MKKALSVLLSVLMLLSMLPIGIVTAATEPTIAVVPSVKELTVGSTFTVSVEMSNNPGVVCWHTLLAYDEAAFELLEQTTGTAFSAGNLDFGPAQSPASALWFDTISPNNTANGVLYTLTFRVLDDAALGDYLFDLYVEYPEDDILDWDLNAVDFALVDGEVTVVDCAHVYDNACDSDCNLCGAVREVSHAIINPGKPVCGICGTALQLGGDPVVYAAADKAMVENGATFDLSVVMGNNPGLEGWQFLLDYDSAVLEMVDVVAADTFADVSFGPEENIPFSAIWLDALHGDNLSNGVLYTITFRVKEDAAFGATDITLGYADEDSIFNGNFETVFFNYQSTCVIVADHIHEYDDACDADCNICGETREVNHHVIHMAAATPSCIATGNIEYWYCDGCGAAWLDEACTLNTNLRAVILPVSEHTYDNACDAECNVCGATREGAGHVYMNPNAPACVNCGATLNLAEDAIVSAAADKASVELGGTFDVTVNMLNNPGLEGWQFLLNYDSAILEIVEVVAADTFSGVSFGPEENIPFSAIWYDALHGDNRSNGTLYTITFRVKADAVLGATDITVGYADEDSIFNGNFETISFAYVGTTVDVIDHTHVYDNACDVDCNVCGETREVENHDLVWTVVVEPTCGQAGSGTWTCRVCGYSYDELIDRTGLHTYDNACDAECNVCGETREVAGHVYMNPNAPACVNCGATLNLAEDAIVSAAADKASVELGGTFDVTVNMLNNPGLEGWQFLLNYDRTILEIVEVVASNTFSGVSFGPEENVPFSAIWYDALHGDNLSNGTLYTITFRVKADALLGSTHITVGCEDPESIFNEEFETVSFDYVGTTVDVIDHAHEYDNACDVDCNICGETREVTHNVVYAAAATPSCYEDGNIEYWYCDVCGYAWLDAECTLNTNLKAVVLPASCAPTAIHNEAIEPGCHYQGRVENWYCANCDVYYLDAECTVITNYLSCIIPALGSENLQHVSAATPSCYEDGNVEYWFCPDCEQYWTDAALTQLTNIKNVVLPMGHQPATHVEAVAPTCTAEGNIEYWYCEACGQAWLDEDCTLNTNLKAVILPMAEHTYDNDYDATCNVCGEEREIPYMPGDLNADGKINIRDLGLLQQYLNNWDVTLLGDGDLNNDGKINIRDLGLLQQYLNNWDVELK